MFVFLLAFLVCSQIWLNHRMDDHHFSYITKLGEKKEKKKHPTLVKIYKLKAKKPKEYSTKFFKL